MTTERERADKRERALNLRMAGGTYEQIAKVVGYGSKSTAYEAVQQALQERAVEQGPLHPAVALELARIDVMLTALWDRARRGELGAARVCLRLGERRTTLVMMHGEANPGAAGDPTPDDGDDDDGGADDVVSILGKYANRSAPTA